MLPERSPDGSGKDRKVIPLCTNDAAIIRGIASREPWAANALYERYAPAILRMLRRTLGYERHADFEDLLHEVFVQALSSAHQLRDSVALLAWLQTIAARVAYRTMRRRRARSWLGFRRPEDLPDVIAPDAPIETRQACDAFFRALHSMPAAEQLLFTLRYVEGMDVTAVAATSSMSLSTAKRRLSKAEARFVKLAQRDPRLATFLKEGGRWPDE